MLLKNGVSNLNRGPQLFEKFNGIQMGASWNRRTVRENEGLSSGKLCKHNFGNLVSKVVVTQNGCKKLLAMNIFWAHHNRMIYKTHHPPPPQPPSIVGISAPRR